MKLESLLHQRQQVDEQIAKLTAKKTICEQTVNITKIKVERSERLIAQTSAAIEQHNKKLSELQSTRDQLSNQIETFKE